MNMSEISKTENALQHSTPANPHSANAEVEQLFREIEKKSKQAYTAGFKSGYAKGFEDAVAACGAAPGETA